MRSRTKRKNCKIPPRPDQVGVNATGRWGTPILPARRVRATRPQGYVFADLSERALREEMQGPFAYRDVVDSRGRAMYLVFDTETTGKPDSYDAPVSNVDNWPRVVQLAWGAFDKRGRKTGAASYVIRPDGFEIPKEAERIHGISTRVAKRTGVLIADVLEEFVDALSESSVLVAHNFRFDASVLSAELYRFGIKHPFRHQTHVCTMEDATEHCALPRKYGGKFKWPKISELHLELFGKKVKETHDAAADVATCARCFFELKRLGVVRVTRRARR